ncbi:MAG TPA: CRISPR-associated protein Cas4 [Balneolales bacterium]|nr:CRISPR-associated protein Cas4 [Balneolales bacterium]
MSITGTHIAYLHTCHRKLWLFANGIHMEHTSDLVAEGKLIGESTYPERAEKYTELQIGSIKIDFYDAKNRVIHEIKKSNKMEYVHEAQLKYYLYMLDQIGITDASGILEYPKFRKSKKIILSESDHDTIEQWVRESEAIIRREMCPPLEKKSICRKCSYFEFCYSGEA